MIRISAGNYRDTFQRRVYDVYRDRLPLGGKIVTGWRFKVYRPNEGYDRPSDFYDTKNIAEMKARRAIAEMTRDRGPDEQ